MLRHPGRPNTPRARLIIATVTGLVSGVVRAITDRLMDYFN
jgi:hypothetical protein